MKRLLIFFLVFAVVMGSTVTSLGQGNVTYDGNAKEFIFEPGSDYSPTDLFSDFKGVMPGDSLSQTITLRNDMAKDVMIKVYMRSLGGHEESKEFLSQLRLRVEMATKGEPVELFEAPSDQPAQLTEWVYLGSLFTGGEIDLTVTLDVPVELDNKYSEQIGYLDWEFKVEEFPIGTNPDTNDRPEALWLVPVVCSVALCLGLLIPRRRKQGLED